MKNNHKELVIKIAETNGLHRICVRGVCLCVCVVSSFVSHVCMCVCICMAMCFLSVFVYV